MFKEIIFTLELIKTYNSLPALWDKSSKMYISIIKKTAQNYILLAKFREMYPTANIRDVNNYIRALRSIYKRFRKVSNKPITRRFPSLDIYMTQMCFLDAMSFLSKTGNLSDNEDEEVPSSKKIYPTVKEKYLMMPENNIWDLKDDWIPGPSYKKQDPKQQIYPNNRGSSFNMFPSNIPPTPRPPPPPFSTSQHRPNILNNDIGPIWNNGNEELITDTLVEIVKKGIHLIDNLRSGSAGERDRDGLTLNQLEHNKINSFISYAKDFIAVETFRMSESSHTPGPPTSFEKKPIVVRQRTNNVARSQFSRTGFNKRPENGKGVATTKQRTFDFPNNARFIKNNTKPVAMPYSIHNPPNIKRNPAACGCNACKTTGFVTGPPRTVHGSGRNTSVRFTGNFGTTANGAVAMYLNLPDDKDIGI